MKKVVAAAKPTRGKSAAPAKNSAPKQAVKSAVVKRSASPPPKANTKSLLGKRPASKVESGRAMRSKSTAPVKNAPEKKAKK